jgi:UDP-N-acetylglucosamine--N-acetylmuramyl-(pentapeptide) pyrophosphoryl-undecaprenol N-acetylglucosamine transferase
MTDTKTVFLVAGGTGGHVFPALALAEELLKRDIHVECITDKRGEKYFRQTSIVPHVVQSSAWATDWKGKLKALMKIIPGMIHSFELCREYSPGVVIGFGGYPSFPTLKAAQLLKVPTILHEQNAVFGRANRQLADGALYIATSFPQMQNFPVQYKNKIAVTGNPIRDVFTLMENTYRLPKEDGKFNIFSFAGSQGSSIFSKVLPAAIEKLDPALRAKITVVQQARLEDVDAVTQAYTAMNVAAKIQPFFKDISKLYRKAHLVIGRAGGSVAEITAMGLPSILVPLAISLDGDQAQNAAQIVANNAGWMIEEKDFTADTLAAKLKELLENPALLQQTAQAAKSLGKPDAAANLADVIEKLL